MGNNLIELNCILASFSIKYFTEMQCCDEKSLCSQGKVMDNPPKKMKSEKKMFPFDLADQRVTNQYDISLASVLRHQNLITMRSK